MRFIKIIIQALLILITLCWISTSFAQVVNDQGNYLGDHIRFSANVPATRADLSNCKPASPPAAKDCSACITASTEMKVYYQDDSFLYVKIDDKNVTTECDGKLLSPDHAYKISWEDAKKGGIARTGITYGLLVVPFKYQLSGDKAFTGSATLGGYVGYRFMTIHDLGITAAPIAFAGASNISVSGTNGTSNTMGFSWGLGLVVTLKGAFQLGGVIGCDSVNSSADYQYNNKPWIAFEIGYSFLQ